MKNGQRSFFMPSPECYNPQTQGALALDSQSVSRHSGLSRISSEFENDKIKSLKRGGKIVQYDVAFDTDEFGKLLQLKKENTVLFEEKRKGQESFTKFNLETAIGERFNAGLSQRRDEIIDGEICDTNMKKPMLAMIKNGVEYRKNNGSSPSDQLREQAEVIGFEKIQDVLTSPFTPVGTMMVSISPPGGKESIYKHNFYDVFTVKEDENGRYVEPRRYSSGLKVEEYTEKAAMLQESYFEDAQANKLPVDAYFLSHPIRIDSNETFVDADAVHADFHQDHEYMEHEQYQEILRLCQPFIHAYLQQLAKDPYDLRARNLRFNALLNKADEVADQLKAGVIVTDVFVTATYDEIERLGEQEVREVGTGCGSSKGASVDEYSPFSVSEFGFVGTDKYGDRAFSCPKCNKRNVRPENELVANCQHCGGDVRC